MDLVVVSVAMALGVRIKVDEVVEGEGVGGAARTGPTTRRGGATKSDRGSGLTPEVSTDSRACGRQGTRMNWLVMVDDWPQYTAGSGVRTFQLTRFVEWGNVVGLNCRQDVSARF